MRIAFIEPGLHICGGIRRILEVSNHLVELGHDVSVFTPRGIPSTWIPSKANIIKLSKLDRFEFDVSVFNLADQYKLALNSKAKAKVFWVLAPEALYKAPQVPLRALDKRFFFIANSKYTRDYILQRVSVDYDIPITPGGINKQHFKYDPHSKKYYHVAFYKSFRPWKGSDLVRHAVNILGLKSLPTDERILQNQMYLFYNQSTIFVSACKVEGFNMPILEAFACGCPVVCTDDGGNRDFVRDGQNALIVKREISSIKLGIEKLLNDKSLRRTFRKAGLREAAKPKYDWYNISKHFESIIKGLI